MRLFKPLFRWFSLFLGCLFALGMLPSLLQAAPPSHSAALDLSGKEIDPLTASQGKVVVLLFVRTDCPVSNRYAPTIQKLSASFSNQARFWLVYPDKNESPAVIRKHDHDFGYTLSALRDTGHVLVKEAHATITPEAAVFAPDGHLVYHGRIDNWFVDFGRKRAAPTTHDLHDAIEAAIAGKPATIPTEHAVGCYIADLN
jgi:thiol-disulfide isomerase/thioredoxin